MQLQVTIHNLQKVVGTNGETRVELKKTPKVNDGMAHHAMMLSGWSARKFLT
jgi:hypothetical protein